MVGDITPDYALHIAESDNQVRLMFKLDAGFVFQSAAAIVSVQLVVDV